VNDAAMMSRMISLGVDGLITDEPGLARDVIAHHQKLSTAERFLLRLGDTIGFAFDLTPEVKDEV
jgi:glycerophosphoryl diester phosphodiesterase